LVAQPLSGRIIAEARDVLPERRELRRQSLLFRRAERGNIVRSLDTRGVGFELDAPRAHPLEIDALEPRLDRREPLLERAPACIEDVVESAEALRPLVEIANQQTDVAIVLQRL